MKRMLLKMLMLMALAVLALQCSKDSNGPDGGTPQAESGQVALSVNGRAWTSLSALATFATTGNNITTVGAGAASGSLEAFGFAVAVVSGNIGVGTYTHSATGGTIIAANFNSPADTTLNSVSSGLDPGTVTFSKLDTLAGTCSGTFEMDITTRAGAKVEIRNGTFKDLPFTNLGTTDKKWLQIIPGASRIR
ncbi:MAG TPA: hypothetical protein PKV71_00960 [Calditrichia bacterium]|nr:hypothetical protein [Calditrichota bacterium]HQU72422.1 hypothetical protein [Calditrichia bacterium]HQV30408.1 hypothetical protein [Calditrichia bacterium]